jgi:PAS domain S-box-containing protein
MSFRLKTILGVALIEAVLLSILVWSGLSYIQTSNEREFAQRAWATVKSFAVTTKDAVLATDLASLESFVAEIMTYPGVRYARVRDMDGLVLAEDGEPELLARYFRADERIADVTDGVFDTFAKIEEADTLFGKVELGVSVAVLQEVIAEARKYSTTIALVEMGLVALFSFFLGLYLTRQLGNLTEASARIANGELGYQVAVRGRDELARTAMAFNLMSEQVMLFYQKVADRERNLLTILENIQDGILTASLDGEVLSFSPAASRIFGYPDSDIHGVMLADLMSPDNWSKLLERLKDPGSDLWGRLREVQGRFRDGSPFPMELTLTRTIQGEREILVGVVRNIGARKKAEEQLRLRDRVIRASSLGVVIADAAREDLPLVYVNPAFESITGYSAAEVLGKNCRFLQGPATDRQALDEIRRGIKAQRDTNVLLRNYRKDGSLFWNELLIAPIRDEQDRLTHFVGLQNDVTERVEGELQLADSEAHLRGVLDATHDAIVVADEHGVIESFNRGAERMFGHSAEEMIGHNVSLLTPSPHRERHDDYMHAYRTSGVSHVIGKEREFEAQRADGGLFPIALRVTEMHKGGRRYFIAVVHDITERKLKENALQQAKVAAEEVAAAKSQFLANMSHEIRTPMHGVLGALELLGDTSLSRVQARYLETANGSAEVLLTVIDEILDFSRLEAGKLHIETLDFDPRKAVEDVTAMLSGRAFERELEIVSYIEPRVPERLKGDPIRLRQVLINLVGNALKFTARGEVVINLSVVKREQGRSVLLFEVKDTGIGIPMDKRNSLFDAFTQADGSTSRRYGGSGLGLSISRRLVELMGGGIGVESTEGVGSNFWFHLPFEHASRQQVPNKQDFAGRRILVVDDNATNRIILHRYLTGWGCSSESAADGEEALAKMQDSALGGQPYHLAILDYRMPGMNGADLARKIRAAPALRDTLLIMASSQGYAEEEGTEPDVNIWLNKPLRQSDLHDAIATVFDAPARRGEERAEERTPAAAFNGERVLLVEDNPVSRSLGREMLRRCGLDVQTAGNGNEALAIVEQEAFHIILMDVQMPEMDGYQATERLLQWERAAGRRHTPIVALTAHALPQDRDRCLAAGMDDYLVKPYNLGTLSNMIRRWLATPGAAATTTRQLGPHEVFEAAKLREIEDMMGDDFFPLVRQFRDTLQDQLALAEAAANADDIPQLRDAVHRVKNNAGDLGASALFRSASALERPLQADRFDRDLLEQFLAQGRKVLMAAQRLFEGESA